MQDPRMPPPEDFSIPKSHKNKQLVPNATVSHLQAKKVPLPVKESRKRNKRNAMPTLPVIESRNANKRNVKTDVSQVYGSDRSNSDSLRDSSPSGGYRALRRKYLLLEEESFSLGRELLEVEDEVKTLEDEKFALLDKLVVLEGLISPAEVPSHRLQLP